MRGLSLAVPDFAELHPGYIPVIQPTLRRPFEGARGLRLRLFPLQKNEGSRAPTGAGAEAPHPVARLAVEPISGSPEMTGP